MHRLRKILLYTFSHAYTSSTKSSRSVCQAKPKKKGSGPRKHSCSDVDIRTQEIRGDNGTADGLAK